MVEKIKSIFSSITIVHIASLIVIPLFGWLLLNGVNSHAEITAMKVQIAASEKATAVSNAETIEKLNTHADKIIIINEMLAVLIEQMKHFETTANKHLEICKVRGDKVNRLNIEIEKLKTKMEAL